MDDGGFHHDNYMGVQDFVKDHPGSSVTPVEDTSGDVVAAIQAVAGIVGDYDVIVCDGFQFGGISEIANDNPDKKFIRCPVRVNRSAMQHGLL